MAFLILRKLSSIESSSIVEYSALLVVCHKEVLEIAYRSAALNGQDHDSDTIFIVVKSVLSFDFSGKKPKEKDPTKHSSDEKKNPKDSGAAVPKAVSSPNNSSGAGRGKKK